MTKTKETEPEQHIVERREEAVKAAAKLHQELVDYFVEEYQSLCQRTGLELYPEITLTDKGLADSVLKVRKK
jgi:hypothetical protein